MLDILDRLGRSGVESGAIGTTGVGSPALLGVKGPDELVTARILLGIAIFTLGRDERDHRRRQHAAGDPCELCMNKNMGQEQRMGSECERFRHRLGKRAAKCHAVKNMSHV